MTLRLAHSTSPGSRPRRTFSRHTDEPGFEPGSSHSTNGRALDFPRCDELRIGPDFEEDGEGK